jgi:hypothetical protein
MQLDNPEHPPTNQPITDAPLLIVVQGSPANPQSSEPANTHVGYPEYPPRTQQSSEGGIPPLTSPPGLQDAPADLPSPTEGQP